MLNLSQLINAPDKGVVSLFNAKDGKVFVAYTSSVINFFTDNLKWLCDGTHPNKELQNDSSNLEFLVLEDTSMFPHNAYGRYRAYIHSEAIKINGWELYNTVKPLTITPKIITTRTAGFKATVFLVLPRYKKIKVRDFDRFDQAQQYLNNTSIDDMFMDTLS